MSEHDSKASGSKASMREARAKTAGVLSAIVKLIGSLAALVLVIYIVLFVGGANPDNGITEFFRNFADNLTLGFDGLFPMESAKTDVLVNYGLAAVFWLVAGAVLSRIISRLG